MFLRLLLCQSLMRLLESLIRLQKDLKGCLRSSRCSEGHYKALKGLLRI